MTTGYSHKIMVIFATYNLFMVCKVGGNSSPSKICTSTLYKQKNMCYPAYPDNNSTCISIFQFACLLHCNSHCISILSGM